MAKTVPKGESLEMRPKYKAVTRHMRFSLGNAFEALLEMWLDARGVFGLGENLQHLIIGEEEESREKESLLFKVGVEAFQDLLQEFIGALEFLKHARE